MTLEMVYGLVVSPAAPFQVSYIALCCFNINQTAHTAPELGKG